MNAAKGQKVVLSIVHQPDARRWLIALLLVVGADFVANAFAQNPADAIVGEWLAAKKDSRVLIYRQGNGYAGKAAWGTGGSAKDEKIPIRPYEIGISLASLS